VKKVILTTIALVLALVMSLVAIPAQAATEEEIQASIEAGVAWMVTKQDGNTGAWGGRVAETGLAVVKLEDRAFEHGMSPFDPDYEYRQNVIDGLNYIFSMAQSDDCGIHFGTRDTYETGIAMMAIAAGGDMNRIVPAAAPFIGNMTYGAVLDACVAYFVLSQDTAGTYEGGWQYGCGSGWADNSNSGYAVLGLAYAQDAGRTVPQVLKDHLSVWIDYIQNDTGVGDTPLPDGGSGYDDPEYWVNLLKTGNLLSEMALVGDNLGDQRVQDALGYIATHWYDANLITGWIGGVADPTAQYQAAYTLMKGLAAMGVPMGGITGVTNWYQDLADVIVSEQHDDGYWLSSPAYVWANGGYGTMSGELLSTLWSLLVLELIAPAPPVVGGEVYAVDVPAASVADVGTESGVSALWIGTGLALVLAIGAGVFVIRRQRAN
jgi:hypothetical protein